jgi:hypothetical protein
VSNRQAICVVDRASKATKVSQEITTTTKLQRSNADGLHSSQPRGAILEVIIAHVELVFAGFDEDETSAFCGSLPDLEDYCQYRSHRRT